MSNPNSQHKKKLVKRFGENKASEKELQAFLGMLKSGEIDQELEEDMDQEIQSIRNQPEEFAPSRKHTWLKYSAAAAILLLASICGYVYFGSTYVKQQTAQNQTHDIAPGGYKAVLTLANGKQIVITDAKNGKLAQQGNTTINKTADGRIIYADNKSGNNAAKEVTYNTITTPRGGQHWIILSDGSKVLLNAASSLRYPTAFTGSERNVELTGEAYFEVVHNAARPFRVIAKGQTVEDLGTHFNINAYADEPLTKTTLLEGSVRISKGSQTAILKPGQQSVIQQNNQNITVTEADTEEAIAWKNGYFLFNNESLVSIMRKISRWYNVDVEYQSEQPGSEVYGGSITRYGNVSKVLKMLEVTGDVRFKVQGAKIIVLKK